ncbi:hypothetical protein Pyn_24113 [Prunus yedoensis var. nudiflora]|uniref:Uncharacterized protein n=1 Tax=Prunus yedoensis var. nudiflora TaxID=2094558 RepID=A0A314YB57_PRUYE|nr:hypothetical protein Pyn_24113 [Prunus yedoensis var. nudiflora]
MAGNILPGEAVHTHELHYGLGDGVLDPQVCHGVHKALVELRGPHEAGPLQRAAGSSPPAPDPSSAESANSAEELGWVGVAGGKEEGGGVEGYVVARRCGGCWFWGLLGLLGLLFLMSKAKARSGVIRVWDKGMSSSGEGSSSSHLENQLDSSSLIIIFF